MRKKIKINSKTNICKKKLYLQNKNVHFENDYWGESKQAESLL